MQPAVRKERMELLPVQFRDQLYFVIFKKISLKKYFPALILFFFTTAAFPQSGHDSLSVSSLNKNTWNYEAWTSAGKHYFPSDGLIVKTDSGLVLIDTPVNDSLTEILLDKFPGQKIALAIITHYHNDRIGGINTLLKKGIPVITYYKTAELAVMDDYPKPTSVFSCSDTTFKIGSTTFELYYPGWGHTVDNIVVWMPENKILYGGCFIKEKKSSTLGNIREANITEWLVAAKEVKKKFKSAKTVIPGHGAIGGKSLINKTISLLEKEF
jgi:metallo-beta-lactamase class B